MRAVKANPFVQDIHPHGDLHSKRRADGLKNGWSEVPELVFCSQTGGPLDERNVTRSWQRLRRAAQKEGVRPLRLHHARHTFASLALASGKSIRWVASQLGHSNPELTLRVYAHALREKDTLHVWMKTKLTSKPRVPVGRAAQVHPFINFLDDLGAPTEVGLERNKLPPGVREYPEMPASIRAIYEFVADMARREGVEDIGWRAPHLAQLSLPLLHKLNRSPTLLHALETLCWNTSLESSHVEIWLEPQASTLLCCHRISIKTKDIGSNEASLLQSKLLVSLVRGFVGSDCMLPEIGIAVDGQIGSVVREALGDTRIHRTSGYGWLRLPRSILCRPSQLTTAMATQAGNEGEFAPAHDLAGSLSQILRQYLSQGSPTVQLAAHLGDMSVRSLQRHLANEGTNYREVVQHTKFEAARELLKQPGVKIEDIAYETGFANPPHFTRFFRQIAGVSPSGYRATISED